jgi:hypothetical protein
MFNRMRREHNAMHEVIIFAIPGVPGDDDDSSDVLRFIGLGLLPSVVIALSLSLRAVLSLTADTAENG